MASQCAWIEETLQKATKAINGASALVTIMALSFCPTHLCTSLNALMKGPRQK